MNKTTIFKNCLIMFSVLLSLSSNASTPKDMSVLRAEHVLNYQTIREKMNRGDKVRVIAWMKEKPNHPFFWKESPKEFTSAKNAMEQQGLRVQRAITNLGMEVYEVDGHELDMLISSGLVSKVEEDLTATPSLLQSLEHIGANIVHADGFTGQGQAVVILDTGILASHPFFGDRVVEQVCFSSNTSTTNSLCPNNQNFQVGGNAANASDFCRIRGLRGCDHGTHVAGIAAGKSENLNGVAPDANIIAIQVFSAFGSNQPGCNGQPCIRSYRSDQIAALNWILENATTENIASINISIGGELHENPCENSSIAEVIRNLRASGIATVIASGNDGSLTSVASPGCVPSAITVGSTGHTQDVVSVFSNSSSVVDILAPGESIQSSVFGNLFARYSGTSLAAPHVTGAFAVMRSINQNATVDDIEQSLKSNGVIVRDSRSEVIANIIIGDGNGLSFPRLDLFASVNSFAGIPISSIDEESYSVIVNRETNFTANSSSDPNELPLTYIWNFGDGESGFQTGEPLVTHTYTDVGTYDLKLSVTNGDRLSDPDDKAKITVYDPAIIVIIVSNILS